MIDDIDYLHNIQRWFCLLVHVHGDTLPQTVKLTFCSSLVGPDQTGLVQPALLPLITGEMEHVVWFLLETNLWLFWIFRN